MDNPEWAAMKRILSENSGILAGLAVAVGVIAIGALLLFLTWTAPPREPRPGRETPLIWVDDAHGVVCYHWYAQLDCVRWSNE